MSNLKLKLSPPWITYVNEVNALFGEDPDINITYDNSKMKLALYVKGAEKAAAISQLMPLEKNFGNISLKIFVIPENGGKLHLIKDKERIFIYAFENNPVLSFVLTTPSDIWDFNSIYVIFKNEVVQFFNDNLKDIRGNMSTLYQDIAEDVFEEMYGVSYCTDLPEGTDIQGEKEYIGKRPEDWLGETAYVF